MINFIKKKNYGVKLHVQIFAVIQNKAKFKGKNLKK